MQNIVCFLENKEIDAFYLGKHVKVKVKDLHEFDVKLKDSVGYDLLDYHSRVIVDDFLFESKNLQDKLSQIREISKKIKDGSDNRFFEWVKITPKAIKNKMEWSTYIFKDANTEMYKIGRSRNVGQRIRHLSKSSGRVLVKIFVFSGDIESKLHLMFSKYRVSGEWFNVPAKNFKESLTVIENEYENSIVRVN